MKPRSEFKAPWSASLRIMTLLASALMLGMPVFLTVVVKESRAAPFLGPLLLLLWFIPLLYQVRGYRVERRVLFIRRLLWETRIELDDLETVELIEAEVIRGSVRVFGNGGLFAFCGWFWNRSLGRYRMWVTDTKRLVLIRCGDRRLVVSPDKPQEFMAALLAGGK